MKLEKFEFKDRKKLLIVGIIIIIILVLSVIYIFNSFALYEEKKEFDVINGTVTNPGDLYFAFYVDGVISKNMPSIDSGYVLNEEKSSCTNNAIPKLDTETWQIKVLNMSSIHTKCTLYFEHYNLATSVITNLAKDANKDSSDIYTVPDKTNDTCDYTLAYDGTSDNNLRYVGKNPCNYVDIEGQKWRIVGVMNDVETSNGTKSSKIKLIKADSIGSLSWDTSDSSVNSGFGINEWSESDLMKLLNPGYENDELGGSLYYNNKSGICYSGISNSSSDCDFTKDGMPETLKSMISAVKWYMGAPPESNGFKLESNGLTTHFYNYERSSNTGKMCSNNLNETCNDDVTRNVYWFGKVGLIYVSDFGFSIGGNNSARTTCLNKELYNWNEIQESCANNSWLTPNKNTLWTMNVSGNSSSAVDAFYVMPEGKVYTGIAYYNLSVLPTVYLNTDVKITSGDGSFDNSYKLIP